MNFVGTFWSLVPPIIAIALALITKEVYSSLFLGILVGGIFYSGFSFEGTVNGIRASLMTEDYFHEYIWEMAEQMKKGV